MFKAAALSLLTGTSGRLTTWVGAAPWSSKVSNCTDSKGTVSEFMARCPGTSCDGVDASTLDWFKISEENYNGEWPTLKVSQTRQRTFTIPADLAPGCVVAESSLVWNAG